MDELQAPVMITCARCGQVKPADKTNKHLCVDCTHAEDTRITYYRQHQGDWMAESQSQGLDVWVQQPGETQWEYTVWIAYRDSYPGKKPSYGAVALQLSTSYNAVRKIAQRWTFPARLQAWIAECDRITLLQRREEILDMNKDHINMAAKLRAKMNTAIDAIIPETLKPGELAALMRLSADLERKARTDTIAQEEMRKDLVVDTTNPELKKSQTKQSDLTEVMQILMKAGAMQNLTAVGVKETTTTTREIVARDDTGAEATLIQGDDDE